jgi:serine/threonine protein kinase
VSAAGSLAEAPTAIDMPPSDVSSGTADAPRYREFARIGRGGMAEVFLAVACEATVSKLVVLKRIWPELASDPTFAAMFLDEARLSVRMSHPNVVQTHEVTEQDGRLTIAMEYLDGQPLTRVQNRLSAARGATELTLALRLRIIIEILAGLGHVHDLTDYDGRPLGVVHRDVSPHNVFITYDGHVKLVDFGVAKMVAASQETRPGTIKGKLAYMAPDQLRPQAQAQTIDRRADLFSVGVILWELLSGRRMWQGMTEVTIVRHLSYGLPLPPLRPMTALPSGLEDVCRKALAMNPDDRYASAGEMEHALQGMLPLVADSHTRHLGKLVSMAFARERAERQAVIDRNLGGGQRPGGETGPPESEPGEARELEPDGPGDPPSTPPTMPTMPTAAGARRGWRWVTTSALACSGLALLGLLVLGGTGVPPGGPAPPPSSSARSSSSSSFWPWSWSWSWPWRTTAAAPAEPTVAGGGHRPARGDVRVDVPAPSSSPTPSPPRTAPLEISGAQRVPALRRARQHRRDPGQERWAWREEPEVGRGQSRQRWLPEGAPPEADTFSVDLGASPPSTRRREIDTESPFSP